MKVSKKTMCLDLSQLVCSTPFYPIWIPIMLHRPSNIVIIFEYNIFPHLLVGLCLVCHVNEKKQITTEFINIHIFFGCSFVKYSTGKLLNFFWVTYLSLIRFFIKANALLNLLSPSSLVVLQTLSDSSQNKSPRNCASAAPTSCKPNTRSTIIIFCTKCLSVITLYLVPTECKVISQQSARYCVRSWASTSMYLAKDAEGNLSTFNQTNFSRTRPDHFRNIPCT